MENYTFNDSGNGWRISVKSEEPLSEITKEMLQNIIEELIKLNSSKA